MGRTLERTLPYDHPYLYDGRQFGGAKLWTPADIQSSLGAWYDAFDEDTITTATGVSQWDDKSDNGNHVTQGTPANQPATGTRTIGGRNALDFNGTSQYLSKASGGTVPDSTQYLMIGVIQNDDGTTNDYFFLLDDTSASEAQYWMEYRGAVGDFLYYHRNNAGTISSAGGDDISGTVARIACSTWDSGSSKMYIDGFDNNADNITATPPPMTGFDKINVGVDVFQSGSFWDGLIGELLFVSGDVSIATRQKLEGYLAWKWGLEANLPAVHPYKNYPPVVGVPTRWTPESIDTAAWYDASDPDTITTDVGVSQLDDKSGNSRHLVQATGSKQPSTGSRTINTLNVLDHNNSVDDQYLEKTSLGLSVSDDIMVIGVFEFDSASFTTARIFDLQEAARGRFGIQSVGTAQFNTRLSLENNDQGWPAGNDFNNNPHNGPSIYCALADGSAPEFRGYVDGIQELSPAVSYAGTKYTSFTDIRVMSKLGIVQSIDGAFAELVISTDVSSETRQKIEGYLAWKWGLQGNLPYDHPYKLWAPTKDDADRNEVDWTPYEIDTEVWVDAADSDTITTGVGVSQWDDKSGNGNHLVQATGANQPDTGVDTIGGLNAISFGGSPEFLATASNPFGASISNAAVFVVLDIKTITSSSLFSLTGEETTGANRWQAHVPWVTNEVYFDCGGTSGANRINYSAGWSANDKKIMGFYCSTTDSVQQIWEDGVLKASDATGHTVSTVGNILLGRSETNYDVCAVGEFIVINGTVSTATRQKIEGYLAHKWGLKHQLPSSHPYRWQPPTIAT